ncbi:dTMP kinase [Paenibacillus sp. An7]|uniref:dTMP kinase n=1 Tax=Paenibacillus sp. An7 TaxID=2689577 RepID=UPI00135B18C6|nr:dTMP kinase [Paenibacillus sp. An7]
MLGKIIVIEGIDGSGKNTQAKLIKEYLQNKDFKCILLHFPMYNETFFGKEVGNYLNGEYGGLEYTHPKLTALLYAGDRFEKREYLKEELEKGTIIILDRYVPSNIAHQSAKLNDDEFENFKKWVEELEYSVFGLPKPNQTIFLDMPPHISYKLVLNKDERDYTEKKQDLHEENIDYLKKVYKKFKLLSESNDWVSIQCYENELPRTIEEINNDILAVVEPVIKN